MSFINNISNHAREIEGSIQKADLGTPNVSQAVLDTRARYQTGPATPGFSFTTLQNRPDAFFYRGMDRRAADDFDPGTTRIIVPWCNMSVPIAFPGTELEELRGLSADQLTDEDFTLEAMSLDDRNIFLDYIGDGVTIAASSAQNARIQALWGKREGILPASFDRFPMSIPQLFDDRTGLYGESVEALGKFERGHPWSETDTASTLFTGENATRFGASRAWKMAPRVYYFNDKDGGDDPTANTGSVSITDKTLYPDGEGFHKLYMILAEFSQIVPGKKLALCTAEQFGKLMFHFEGSSKFPLVVAGTERWEYRYDCVRLGQVYCVMEPQKAPDEDTIEVLTIGDNVRTSTIFPFYWVKRRNMSDMYNRENDYMNMEVPIGMDFGARRDVTFYLDKFHRFDENEDAVGSHQRLKYMNVCTAPWAQLQIRGIK